MSEKSFIAQKWPPLFLPPALLLALTVGLSTLFAQPWFLIAYDIGATIGAGFPVWGLIAILGLALAATLFTVLYLALKPKKHYIEYVPQRAMPTVTEIPGDGEIAIATMPSLVSTHSTTLLGISSDPEPDAPVEFRPALTRRAYIKTSTLSPTETVVIERITTDFQEIPSLIADKQNNRENDVANTLQALVELVRNNADASNARMVIQSKIVSTLTTLLFIQYNARFPMYIKHFLATLYECATPIDNTVNTRSLNNLQVTCEFSTLPDGENPTLVNIFAWVLARTGPYHSPAMTDSVLEYLGSLQLSREEIQNLQASVEWYISNTQKPHDPQATRNKINNYLEQLLENCSATHSSAPSAVFRTGAPSRLQAEAPELPRLTYREFEEKLRELRQQLYPSLFMYAGVDVVSAERVNVFKTFIREMVRRIERMENPEKAMAHLHKFVAKLLRDYPSLTSNSPAGLRALLDVCQQLAEPIDPEADDNRISNLALSFLPLDPGDELIRKPLIKFFAEFLNRSPGFWDDWVNWRRPNKTLSSPGGELLEFLSDVLAPDELDDFREQVMQSPGRNNYAFQSEIIETYLTELDQRVHEKHPTSNESSTITHLIQ